MTKIKAIHESGRSTIEMLGVLAIIGVLSIAGIAGYSQAMAKHKINRTIDQINVMNANIRTLFGAQKTYRSLDTVKAFKAGILTDETYDRATQKGVNPYGGEIILSSVGTGHAFSVTYTDLPQDVCRKLAIVEWGSDATSGLESMTFNNGTAGRTYKWSKIAAELDSSLPITTQGALTACDGPQMSITWQYR